nr:hypothetical protein [Tanacetum cinerariifolium]
MIASAHPSVGARSISAIVRLSVIVATGPWGCAFELGKVVESWEKWRVMWRKAGKCSSGGKNAGGKR